MTFKKAITTPPDKEGFFWESLYQELSKGFACVLLLVVESSGSSPGRQGFKQWVSLSGMQGSIGGGIMEVKLVELAKSKLAKKDFENLLIPQIHRKDAHRNQSGMICSGHQKVALHCLQPQDRGVVGGISMACRMAFRDLDIGRCCLLLSRDRLKLNEQSGLSAGAKSFIQDNENKWTYSQAIPDLPVVHIFGAGHVGLALSRQMAFLGFVVCLYDDRPDLNTFEENAFAHRKTLIDYSSADEQIKNPQEEYVVVMTFGYRPDKEVVKSLLKHSDYRYLGLMGSQSKIDRLFSELKAEGYPEQALAKIKAPIGLPIHSKTPEEIALSVAAEIVRLKNAPHI